MITTTPQPRTAADLPAGADPYKDWTDSMGDELNASSKIAYRTLWDAWCWWLGENGQTWSTATAATIQQFLGGPAPERAGRRKALSATHMSSYTRQRYWRILRGVYHRAVASGKLANNPTLDVPDEKRPSISEGDRLSQVLEPAVFKRLRKAKTLATIIKVKNENDWWHVRDRAMLAVLVETGITTSELIALRGVDLRRTDNKPLSLQQVAHPESNSQPLLLEVMLSDQLVGRQLEISQPMAELVLMWVCARAALFAKRSGRPPNGEAGQHQPDWLEPLFVARRAAAPKPGVEPQALPPMDPTSVYYAVSQALKRLRKSAGSAQPAAGGPHVAQGPAVIRNSVIRLWLDTLEVPEVVARAGLKRMESLRLKAE